VAATDSEWIPAANAKSADSTCSQIIANGRTVTDTFYLHVRLGTQSTNEALRVFQRTALQEMLPYLRVPDTLVADFAWEPDSVAWRVRKPRRASGPSPRDSGEIQTIGGELDAMLSFDIGREGKIEDLRVSFPSQVRALHDSLTVGLRAASAAGAIPPVPANLTAPQHFDVRFAMRERRERGFIPVDTIYVRFPVYTKDAVVSTMNPPSYPYNAKVMGLDGMVMTSFVIEADGTVRPGSLRILEAKYADFIRAVAASLKTARYKPYEYRGCPIPGHAHQPFEFAMGG
jgi:outer membrane biosynthesis protein TonB